jgi:hypothetical protein
MSAERSLRYQQEVQKRVQQEAEERALEKKHGGKEALAKWRSENAEMLRAEKAAADAKARQEAADKVIIDQFVTLQAELAKFGPLDLKSASQDLSALVVTKAMVTVEPRAHRAFTRSCPRNAFVLPTTRAVDRAHLAASNSCRPRRLST